ncbi:hypothetical protein B0181_10165 [Moraxella caviae]|uniref:Uncharacterized protein n=1 Tax=Moraxella caviae TaxID=34060 RepID=A0A1S9ZVH2_9GAMM|nr:hypothetical protein [Moraxella caviae]OOR87532.1 hypothetical protein B0181_10165 [Moraxella caviae]STZ10065.1 Uncharacterised protein [Moraxella caviae]VEW12744.1 Uncharacterised protein [Moraxella caviae]
MHENYNWNNAKRPDDVPEMQAIRQALKSTSNAKTPEKPTNAIADDVWQLIRQRMDNPADLERMNGMIRLLFA